MADSTSGVKWLARPEDHDYPAAASYLSLLRLKLGASYIVNQMRAGEVTRFKAKDIIRAAGLPVLDASNKHVAKNVKKIRKGVPLSPILLVAGSPLIIADGYHRACAVEYYDEDAWVYAVIV